MPDLKLSVQKIKEVDEYMGMIANGELIADG